VVRLAVSVVVKLWNWLDEKAARSPVLSPDKVLVDKPFIWLELKVATWDVAMASIWETVKPAAPLLDTPATWLVDNAFTSLEPKAPICWAFKTAIWLALKLSCPAVKAAIWLVPKPANCVLESCATWLTLNAWTWVVVKALI
jgi:hypothetical protein